MRDINKYTEDYITEDFEKYQVLYRRKKVLQIIKKYKSKKILEIGCGMEPLFKFLNDVYDEYTIIEPSPVFYQNACKEAMKDERIDCINDFFGINKKIYCKSYDMILCSSLLHEVENPNVFILNLRKACSKETIVHINVPNANSFHRLLAEAMGAISDVHDMSKRNKLLQQNIVYDMQLLRKEVEAAGFHVVDEGSYFIKPFSHAQMWEMIQKNVIDEKILDGLYNLERYFPEFGSEIFVNIKM